MTIRWHQTDPVPVILSAPECLGRRVLVFAPHPDDEIFGCGGTLCLLTKAGADVSIVIISDGALGGSAAHLIEIREAESRSAASVIGVPAPTFWRLPDRGVAYGEALVTKMLAMIESVEADLVFAPAISEIHPDHQAVSLAAAEAIRRLGGERRLAFYEISAPLVPNTIVDISTVETIKRQSMNCFHSQLTEQPYAERIAALNRYRAYLLGPGKMAAEAFFMTVATELDHGFLPPSQLQEKVNFLERELVEARLQRDIADRRLQAAFSSASWTCTKPLRLIKRFATRLMGRSQT
ncbi:N-acetylglucosamine malate deacetylase 1 [Gammaproteobacteria bacterium]